MPWGTHALLLRQDPDSLWTTRSLCSELVLVHRPQLREERSDVIRAEDALSRTMWGEVGVCVL